jgi:hypothetical protein
VGIGTTNPQNTLNVVGTGNITSTLYAGSCAASGCTDIAELFPVGEQVSPGDVLCISADGNASRCHEASDERVLGVVSTRPAIIIEGDHVVLGTANYTNTSLQPIALKGRVPVKVVCPVHIGDRLVSASKPGFAQAVQRTEFIDTSTLVGKALQSCAKNESTVLAWVG